MSLLKTIEEQTVFNFTGKVNLLTKENSQFVGSVFLKDGQISNSYFGKFPGLEALLSLVLYDQKNQLNCRYIVEPEIIDSLDCAFHLNITELKFKSRAFALKFKSALNLRPPLSLHIRVSPSFIEKEASLNRFEYSILQVICNFSLVEEIYKQSELPEYIITIGLVSLREKGALKVCKNT